MLCVWLPLNGDLHNQGLRQNLNIIGTDITFSNNGKIGKCADFNGTSSRIYIPNFSIDNQWSYGCWVNTPTSDTRGWELVIMLNNSGSDADSQLAFWIHQKENRIESLANTKYTSTIPYTPYYNSWHHFFATYNGTVLTSYIDGTIVKTQTITDEKYTGTNLTIGARCTAVNGSSFSYFFQGSLNDVRIYDHCLSQKEVEEISKGLVLHYKLDDRFCESTTNLCTSGTLGNNAYNDATGKYSYGSTTDMYKTTGIFQGKQATKVYMGTTGKSAYPHVWFDNIHPSQNQYKTLSFDYYPTSQTTLIFYTYNGSGTTTYSVNNGSVISGTSIPVKLNQWNHIVFTILGTSNKTSGWGYVRIGSSTHTSTTTDYWLFANIQVEEKDHATGYAGVGGSRVATTIYDSSGYNNNGTIVGSLETTTPSPRYSCATSFDENTDSITVLPYLSNGQTLNEITISCWFKTNTLNSTAPNIFSLGENAFLRCRLASATSIWSYYRVVSTQKSSTYSCKNLIDNTWHLLTFIFQNGVEKVYLDGEQIGSTDQSSTGTYLTCANIAWHLARYRASSENFIGALSDFRIYTTALTAKQVKELYNTSATIDNQGNIYARELVE